MNEPARQRAAAADDASRGAAAERPAVQAFLSRAVTRGERVYTLLRAVFCTAVVLRFLISERDVTSNVPRMALELGVASGVVVFSLWEHRRARTTLLGPWVLLASVAVDATGCLAQLATLVLWPFEGYDGLLATPDAAALLLITAATGLRLSRRVALWGSAACMVGMSLLVALDWHLNGNVNGASAALSLVYLCGAAALAVVIADRTRQLVTEAATQASRAEAARGSLSVVLRDHHDVRSVVCAIQLQADALLRKLGPDAAQATGAAKLVGTLRSGLDELNASVAAVRDQAQREVTNLELPSPASVADALAEASEQMRRVHASLDVATDGPSDDSVLAPGGTHGLAKLLLTLLHNAAEGDGDARSTRVAIRVRPGAVPGFTTILVEDDGPGFPPEQLERQGREPSPSRKRGSSGLGVWLVASAARSCGGQLTLANTPHGARVTLLLPDSDASDAT